MAAIEINLERDVLIISVTGNTSAEELIGVINEHYPREDVRDVIWNFTHGSWSQIPKHGFKRVAKAAKSAVMLGTRQGSKTAFVGTAGLEYGLHRMYQTTAEITGVPVEYNAFNCMSKALQWIGHKDF